MLKTRRRPTSLLARPMSQMLKGNNFVVVVQIWCSADGYFHLALHPACHDLEATVFGIMWLWPSKHAMYQPALAWTAVWHVARKL